MKFNIQVKQTFEVDDKGLSSKLKELKEQGLIVTRIEQQPEILEEI